MDYYESEKAMSKWKMDNLLPEEQRGKLVSVFDVRKQGLLSFYEEPPYGRNPDGSVVLPPEFGAYI